jgi:hypothetical protein
MIHNSSSRTVSLTFACVFLSIAFPHPLPAAGVMEEPARSFPWFTLGLGGATHRFALSANVSYPIGCHLLSAHFIYLTEIVQFTIPGAVEGPQSENPDRPANKDIEYAFLYGIHQEGDFGLASISTGVSVIRALHVFQASSPNSLVLREG